jgi:hypothetical protein
MRLVARRAGHSTSVAFRIYLREHLGFGGIRLVALYAQDRRIQLLGDLRTRVLGVYRLRSMAGLARDVGMLTGLLQLENLLVAGLANIVPGEDNRAGSDFCHGVGTEMPVAAEAMRDDKAASNQEDRQRSDEYGRNAD